MRDNVEPISQAQFGERQVFKGAVSMRNGDWQVRRPVCYTIVTVFESSASSETSFRCIKPDEGCIRALVYYVKMGAYAQVDIKSFEDLRQVIFSAKVSNITIGNFVYQINP